MNISLTGRHLELTDAIKAHITTSIESLGKFNMDIISVNCPHTEATHHLLSKEMLAKIPNHAYLVNTSRGEVIDEAALADALMNNSIAGAGLDVYENQPEINSKLINLKNVVLLPHIGSATIEGRLSMGDKVIINIQTFTDGHTPPDRVIEVMI